MSGLMLSAPGDRRDGQHQNPEIKDSGPVLDVEVVVFGAVGDRGLPPEAVHLGPAGDAGLHPVPVAVATYLHGE